MIHVAACFPIYSTIWKVITASLTLASRELWEDACECIWKASDGSSLPFFISWFAWSFFLVISTGPNKWLLQCQYLQGAPYANNGREPVHRGEEPHQHRYPGQAASTDRHVLHQHLLHPGSRSQPSVRLQSAFCAGHGQQLHWALRAGVPARLTERLQLLYRHAVRQQRQQLQ